MPEISLQLENLKEKDLETTLFGSNNKRAKKGKEIQSSSEYSESDSNSEEKSLKPVWKDSDDEEAVSSKSALEKPKWSRIKKGKSKKCKKSILSTDRPLINTSKTREANEFTIVPYSCLKRKDYLKRTILNIDFTPNGEMLLIAAANKEIKIFQQEGEKYERIQTLKFPKIRIDSVKFSHDGTAIFLLGNRNLITVYSLTTKEVFRVRCGEMDVKTEYTNLKMSRNGLFALSADNGTAVVYSALSLKEVTRFKINGTLKDLTFLGDNSLICVGGDAEIYKWDIKNRNCSERIKEESSVHCTAIGASECGTFLATGNDTGHLSIYKNNKLVKVFDNLVTEIKEILFNRSSEFLVVYSALKPNAIRLVHLKSMKMFREWPASRLRVGFITSVAISDDSKFLVLGSRKGEIGFFKVPYFFDK